MTTNSRSLPGRSSQSRTSSSAEVRVLWSLTGMLLRLGSHPMVSLSHLRQQRHSLVSSDHRPGCSCLLLDMLLALKPHQMVSPPHLQQHPRCTWAPAPPDTQAGHTLFAPAVAAGRSPVAVGLMAKGDFLPQPSSAARLAQAEPCSMLAGTLGRTALRRRVTHPAAGLGAPLPS